MAQQHAAEPRGQGPQLLDLLRPAADIEQRPALQLRRRPGRLGGLRHRLVQRRLQRGDLVLQRRGPVLRLLRPPGQPGDGLVLRRQPLGQQGGARLLVGQAPAQRFVLRRGGGCRRRGLAPCRLLQLRHPPGQGLALGPDLLQPLLLPGDPVVAGAELLLQVPQPGDVGTVRHADEMRQHVHLAIHLLHQRPVGGGVAQHRPIGAGDVAALQRLLPQRPHLRRIPSLGEALDRGLVPLVEQLVQQLAGDLLLPRGPHRPAVQRVLGGGARIRVVQLGEELPQVAGRQAGADHRAMQVGRQLPDPVAALGREGGVRRLDRQQARDGDRWRRQPRSRPQRMHGHRQGRHAETSIDIFM